ncbi:MAG TPA: phosphate/phosphite/phosphonate ABC transporter substrate-binding protein [Methyloversatilis sp.]
MTMNPVRLLSLLFCLLSLSAAAADPRPLRVGIAPHTSSRVILEMYQPLRVHLEKALGVPVQIITAPDFTEYARRALDQEYDLAITTGHQAQLLKTDAAYVPLLTYKAPFRAVIVVARDGKVAAGRDLAGAQVVGLGPSSLVTIWGLHWMRDNGAPDVSVRYVSAADSVAQLILNGDVLAGTVSLANFQVLAPDVQSQLRFLAESPALAGRVYMLNSSESGRAAAIQAALWSFAESPAGKEYFAKYKVDGYRKLAPGELDVMAPYAAEVRQQLKKANK